ncbi:hypothetical protein [Bacillus sp. REN3]|uniref:hypothetical protein n=1 Tax=Bacillus sp. REN3 TaxID=2802440 RepID=UPI001AEE0061|nr:hypothetical protein [Bacillus sp. REN3]
MKLGIFLVIVTVIAAAIFTLLLAGKGDDQYSTATKRNTINLSAIYIVVILLSFIAVGIYIRFFA